MILQYLKLFLSYLSAPKYKRKGKCNRCGNCCRNILFFDEKIPVSSEEHFESIKKQNKYYNNFYISGRSENGALLFTCRELSEDNRCKVYNFRCLGCRVYPKTDVKFLVNGGKPLDGCGYYFEIEKDFKSYLGKNE